MKKDNSVQNVSNDAASPLHTNMQAPQKLKVLITVVNRSKSEYYADLIQSFEANMQIFMAAKGTASLEILNYLGATESDKSVILSVIREDMEKAILSALDEKFRSIKNGKGIAYTVSMTSLIGVSVYQFLSNNHK